VQKCAGPREAGKKGKRQRGGPGYKFTGLEKDTRNKWMGRQEDSPSFIRINTRKTWVQGGIKKVWRKDQNGFPLLKKEPGPEAGVSWLKKVK